MADPWIEVTFCCFSSSRLLRFRPALKRPWWRAHAWVGEIAADSDKIFQFVALSSWLSVQWTILVEETG